MRILICSINYFPEMIGVGKYTGEMSEWLCERGCKVRVITSPPYYPQWCVAPKYSSYRYKKEIIKQVIIYRCPLYVPRNPSGAKRLVHLLSFALSSFPVYLLQIFWRPQVIFVIEPTILCAPSALLLSSIFKTKTILHIQDYEIDAAFELGLLKNRTLKKLVNRFEQWILRRVNLVSTISPKMIEKLNEKKVAKDKQYLFPNWVDTEDIAPLDHVSEYVNQLKFEENTTVALYSGNMGNKQGLEIIIEAARVLKNVSNIKFVLCGDGSAADKLRKSAAGLTNLVWLPLQPLDKLNELLGLASIHLLPQSSDAADLVMPSKLTGMLASGKPIVTTSSANTQVGTIVEHCGILVEPGDSLGFANAIEKLYNDKKLCELYGKKARQYAVDHLEKKRILDKFQRDLAAFIKD